MPRRMDRSKHGKRSRVTPDPAVELREIAAALGTPLTRTQGLERIDFRRRRRRVRWFAQRPMLVHVTGFQTTIAFAAGQPQPLQLLRTPLSIRAPMPLFGRRDGRWSPATWLARDTNLQLLARLDLRQDDYVSLALNWLTWSFQPRGVEPDLERFEALLSVADALPVADQPTGGIDGLEADLSRLPAPLRSLVPLIRTYAISDDVLRAEQLAAAPSADIAALTALTKEQWDAINQFLDEHIDHNGAQEQDIALVLGAFAEAAADAATLAQPS